jgi:hypothetical protein
MPREKRNPTPPSTDPTSSSFIVLSEAGERLLETSDIFEALASIKRQPPGAKLMRSDGVLIAYRSGYKPPKDVKGFY